MDDIQDGEITSVSPTPQKVTIPYDFPSAIEQIINGKKVTRIEWNNSDTYGLLKDGFLTIYTNNDFHRWIVSDGDMLATDWVVL